jgi:DNA polymerase III epsilon subunit-like protein
MNPQSQKSEPALESTTTAKASYFALDCETGGTDAGKNPVLTLCLLALGADRAVLAELNLKIRPEAPFDNVEAEALSVNKIDLQQHISDPETLTRSQASQEMRDFLARWSPQKKRGNPKLIGHNVVFDLDFVYAQLMPKKEWESSVHYGLLDTSGIIGVLKDAGVLPPEVGSLGSACKHFGVELNNAHDARADTLATVELYSKIAAMLGSSNAVGLSIDALDILER